MSRSYPVTLPLDPVPVEDVIEMFPYVRQSLLSRFDECKLTTKLELEHGGGWDGHPQARGHLFHRFAAEALRTLRRQGETKMPVAEALEVLYEVVRQRNVPPEDRVRVPMRQLRELRMAVIKWAHDNTFSTDRIMSIEQRYNAPITYVSKEGELVTRLVTGQLDVLIADPPDGAVVIDWKDTWGLPPANTRGVPDAPEDDGSHLSYSGYFQQRFYALLVMHNFPAVQTVKLREFYHRHATAREGIVTRDSLEHVTRELSVLVADFDETVAAGAKHAGTLSRQDPWRPSPGKHCFGGETRFFTDQGVRTLRGAHGETVRVLNRHGKWEEAAIRSFGRQPLVRVRFDDGSEVRATADHRWWLMERDSYTQGWYQTNDRITTTELERAPVTVPAVDCEIDDEGVRHGFTYGGGWPHMYREVVSIKPDSEEEVFCAVVPGSESFTLASGIATSNCSMCPKPASCPIEREARGEGAIDSDETAQRYAGEFEVATQVRVHRMKALKPWTSEHGPVELASSKGRRAVGMQQTHTLREGVKRRGTRFGTFTPEESDRGAEPDDAHLEQALQESIEEVERVRSSR